MRRKIRKVGLLCLVMIFLCGCSTSWKHSQETEKKQGQTALAFQENTKECLTVTFLDVGQGNAVLLAQAGHYALIDGGGRERSSYLVAYLQEQGVEKLDYVIASHYDEDHVAGLVGALNVFRVGTILDPDYEAETKIYRSYVDMVEQNGCREEHPQLGAAYTFAGDVEITVVTPKTYDYSEANDNSIGVRITKGEDSFLILGDASAELEEEMIGRGQADPVSVYLASHHGSKYSSSRELLERIDPEAVVVSCGAGNRYGHPAGETLERIRETKARLYRTDLQGEVEAVTSGNGVRFLQEPCNDFTSGENFSSVPEETEPVSGEYYAINPGNRKIHRKDCKYGEQIRDKEYFTGTLEEVRAQGCIPCQVCLKKEK